MAGAGRQRPQPANCCMHPLSVRLMHHAMTCIRHWPLGGARPGDERHSLSFPQSHSHFPLSAPTLRSVAICAARPTAGHFATSGRCLLSDMNSLAGECRRSAHTKAQRLAIARDVGDQRNARPGCGKERSQPSDGRDWSAKRGSRPLHLAPNPVDPLVFS